MNKLAQDINNAARIKLANLAALKNYAPELVGGALGGVGGYAASHDNDSGLEIAGKSGIGALLGALLGHGGNRMSEHYGPYKPTPLGRNLRVPMDEFDTGNYDGVADTTLDEIRARLAPVIRMYNGDIGPDGAPAPLLRESVLKAREAGMPERDLLKTPADLDRLMLEYRS